MIETGWREVQGQRAYVDFLTTTPPGFNLGIEYAYRLFGVNWNANLYLTAIFACGTFLWIYWLLVRLSLERAAAIAVAFAVECAGVLVLSFWWYNDTVLTLAAVFYLSCLLYYKSPDSMPTQVSYVASLALIGLMKPNVAGLTIAGCVALLFFASRKPTRLVLLTLGGTALAVVFLFANHVDTAAMLRSYLSVSREHGGLQAQFGFRQLDSFARISGITWIGFVSLPLLCTAGLFRLRVHERQWRVAAYLLLFPMALLVAAYGLVTNGEYRDVECTLLLAAGGVLAFTVRPDDRVLRRIYVAILCTSIVGALWYAEARIRVYTIGPGVYFEWHDNQNRIVSGYLKDMRVSSTMVEVEREARLAMATNPGPYFFGQRLDFNYAALSLPSPRNFPAWWEPGTSFPPSKAAALIDGW